MPHVKSGVSANLTRDFRDQIRRADTDRAGTIAHYAYDASGQRVRRVVDKGSVVEERIYLGSYEVWRKRSTGTQPQLRQTPHVMDGQRRIAMVETLTVDDSSPPEAPSTRIRYQLDDHLGTASLETDDDGAVISYEEYHPYGSTAWYANDGSLDGSPKRYRYTGMERDDETGLQYHSARYYAPWLGRWASADPAGLRDGLNRHAFCGRSPIRVVDQSGLAGEGEPLNKATSDEQARRDLLTPMVRRNIFDSSRAGSFSAADLATPSPGGKLWATLIARIERETGQVITGGAEFLLRAGPGVDDFVKMEVRIGEQVANMGTLLAVDPGKYRGTEPGVWIRPSGRGDDYWLPMTSSEEVKANTERARQAEPALSSHYLLGRFADYAGAEDQAIIDTITAEQPLVNGHTIQQGLRQAYADVSGQAPMDVVLQLYTLPSFGATK